MLAIRGAKSRIAVELAKLVHCVPVREVARGERMPPDASRYLFCAGLLTPTSLEQMDRADAGDIYWHNCGAIIQECERILWHNGGARICVVGSESAFTGSFNQAYATAKAGLHSWVETRRLDSPAQQLVCVSPGIVSDCGMTQRRTDKGRLQARELGHPKGRFMKAREVAAVVHFLLFQDQGYITNQVIRMNGGEHLKR